ncbi:GspH/FimT family pseudopilin [Cellvibrio polysaccharolyticus]|nr:GspH/FimT family protein [Cellvibrio polysaccharolyticus]
MKSHGFTLLELLITLLIFAILINIAIPGYKDLRQRDQVRTTTLDFYQAVQLTRSHAVSRNTRVTIANIGGWENGWEIFADTNNNGIRDEDEEVLLTGQGTNKVQIISNRFVSSYISFLGSGRSHQRSQSSQGAVQAGTFHICHPEQPQPVFELKLSRGGRLSMTRVDENPCISNEV